MKRSSRPYQRNRSIEDGSWQEYDDRWFDDDDDHFGYVDEDQQPEREPEGEDDFDNGYHLDYGDDHLEYFDEDQQAEDDRS